MNLLTFLNRLLSNANKLPEIVAALEAVVASVKALLGLFGVNLDSEAASVSAMSVDEQNALRALEDEAGAKAISFDRIKALLPYLKWLAPILQQLLTGVVGVQSIDGGELSDSDKEAVGELLALAKAESEKGVTAQKLGDGKLLEKFMKVLPIFLKLAPLFGIKLPALPFAPAEAATDA